MLKKENKRTWEIVEVAQRGDTASRAFDISILTLIALNVVAVIIGSVRAVQTRFGTFLDAFELVSVLVFTIEYLVRLWSCTMDTRFRRPLIGRIRFALQGMSLIDLAAILPFYLPFLGVDLRYTCPYELHVRGVRGVVHDVPYDVPWMLR